MSTSKVQVNPDVLRFDGLDSAERITGKDYKTDEATSYLGLLLSMENNALKNEMLDAADDTSLSNDLDNYMRIITDEGFQLVLTVPFKGRSCDESMYVYWHPDGIFLKFDTYGSTRVNGGSFYYNWIPNEIGDYYRFTSSGGFRDHNGSTVWVGDHDCREALRHHISQLRENGTFLSTWIEQPFLWILHYGDTEIDGYDYKQINKDRIALLPADVQKAIIVKETLNP